MIDSNRKITASIFVLEDYEDRMGNDLPIEIFSTRSEAIEAWKDAGGRISDFQGYFMRFTGKIAMIDWIKEKLG